MYSPQIADHRTGRARRGQDRTFARRGGTGSTTTPRYCAARSCAASGSTSPRATRKTATCAIEWVYERAFVDLPQIGRPEEDVLADMQRADWIGIDAPFGWPDAMVDAVHTYAVTGRWPHDAPPERLRYRVTDWLVHEVIADERDVSVWPLSVLSDRIAVCAWRCAALLRAYSDRTEWELDRVGVENSTGMGSPPDAPRPIGLVAVSGIVEVYPAGALAMWGLPHKGYKRISAASSAGAHKKRAEIMAAIEQLGAGWLILTSDVRDACVASDDALDAFVSSVVACAAATDRTLKPDRAQRGAAHREGWIHLPAPDSLESLAPAAV
jgi:hypothetical protein